MKDLLTPRGWLVRAAVLVLLFAALHLAGLRPRTSVLCATLQDEGAMQAWNAFLAMAYIITYLLAVVLAPVLALAAALLAVWNRVAPPPPAATPDGSGPAWQTRRRRWWRWA